ncbi:hypothetical protein [Mycoplasmopsis columboralis]|uniref:Uncharacterized protein n=1 Tax=Mycoplasmopsis columboralis TaxID=171282 RepID=A0A449B6G4_9BACT|nr:hypothetical protein [Mycoplasmopsis columboralis]VEU76201.1 Uncharacterised protein [Mycoplasmopsis columboralis]
MNILFWVGLISILTTVAFLFFMTFRVTNLFKWNFFKHLFKQIVNKLYFSFEENYPIPEDFLKGANLITKRIKFYIIANSIFILFFIIVLSVYFFVFKNYFENTDKFSSLETLIVFDFIFCFIHLAFMFALIYFTFKDIFNTILVNRMLEKVKINSKMFDNILEENIDKKWSILSIKRKFWINPNNNAFDMSHLAIYYFITTSEEGKWITETNLDVLKMIFKNFHKIRCVYAVLITFINDSNSPFYEENWKYYFNAYLHLKELSMLE